MKSLARELGRSGTTANTVSLGLVETAHERELGRSQPREADAALSAAPARPAGRRRADGDDARLATQRLDHRAGAQHQRRLQHGLKAGNRDDDKRCGDAMLHRPDCPFRNCCAGMPARGARSPIATRRTRSPTPRLLERTGKLAGHLADTGIARRRDGRDHAAEFRAMGRRPALRSPAPARSASRSAIDATETEIAYRLVGCELPAIVTTGERSDLVARLRATAPNLATLIVTGRGERGDRASLRAAGAAAPKSAPRDPAAMHDTVLHPLHVGHHRTRQGRAADCARHAVGHGRVLGADHGL